MRFPCAVHHFVVVWSTGAFIPAPAHDPIDLDRAIGADAVTDIVSAGAHLATGVDGQDE